MAFILNIDTASESASISISQKDEVIDLITNGNQKDHASFLQPSIKSLLKKNDLTIDQINAISVTAGPGSYTGLRVGMASAKGLCYALKIPLITLNTLEVIAWSSIKQTENKNAMYSSLIDARRMEVFSAVYDHHLAEIIHPGSMIIDAESFADLLKTNKVYFSGSGISKLRDTLDNHNAIFLEKQLIPESMADLSWKNYQEEKFADIFYSSPLYLKEFYTLKNNM